MPRKSAAKPLVEMKEKDVANFVMDFFRKHGWQRKVRNNLGSMMNPAGQVISLGEKGRADLLFVRYLSRIAPGMPGLSLTCWVETKHPRSRGLKPHQEAWITEERSMGAVVLVVFTPDDLVTEYYRYFGWLHGRKGAGQLRLFIEDKISP